MLDTYPSAVRELDYTITVPAGSLLAGTTLTVGLGFPERVAYIHSLTQPWGTLRIAATVQTQPGVAPFTTTMQATSLLATGAASGRQGAAGAGVGAGLGRRQGGALRDAGLKGRLSGDRVEDPVCLRSAGAAPWSRRLIG